MHLDDTIVAISSAVGQASRMILRASGPDARRIMRGICPKFPQQAGAAFAVIQFSDLEFPAHLYCFIAPASYTGQDLVELHIPGNPLLARMLMDELIRCGARAAEAGEFTARAYFNGKLDLTQAEGVAAAIEASSAQQMNAARQLMAGELSRRLRPAMNDLADLLALTEVEIDFSEEDVRFLSDEATSSRIDAVLKMLGELIAGSAQIEKLSHEPRIVLAGRPNAGKSTLINALAGQERSIISPAAGTTRDVLSAPVMLRRGRVQVVDVAGLEDENDGEATEQSSNASREISHDPIASIEQQMQAGARRAIEEADVLLLVRGITDERADVQLPREADLRVLSKCDLADEKEGNAEISRSDPLIKGVTPAYGNQAEILVSAQTGAHMPVLRRLLDDLAFGHETAGAALTLTARHRAQIELAADALNRAANCPPGAAEILAAELRQALDCLGEVLGIITPDDLLGRIFSSFCIGK